jgi:hypothetical protein
MNDKGEIVNLTDEQYAQLSRSERDALVALTYEQAVILEKLPREEREQLYPLLSKRGKRRADARREESRGR